MQIWASITCNKYISKTITASSLSFGQLNEGGYVDYLMKRMVDKLMVGGIVFHKHNF